MELQELLPPDVRRKAYLIFGLVGALLTATGVGLAAAAGAGLVAPAVVGAVLAVAVAVYGSLGASFGWVAGSNVPKGAPSGEVPEYTPRRAADLEAEEVPDADLEPVSVDEPATEPEKLS